MPSSEDDELITSEEVMQRLLSHPKLRRAALTCVLPAVRHGDEWRFRRSDLEAWVLQQLVAGGTRES